MTDQDKTDIDAKLDIAWRMGLRDGLERAAKIVESRPNIGMDTQLRLLAEAIRAEADKPEPAERKPRVWRDSAGVCHGPATCGCEPSRG